MSGAALANGRGRWKRQRFEVVDRYRRVEETFDDNVLL